MHILHIAAADAWQRARALGRYAPPSLEREGFVHCSTPEQLLLTANSYYRAQQGLVLLVMNAAALGARLRFEAPAAPAGLSSPHPEGARLPHVYGPIELAEVERVIELTPREDGTFELPAELR